MTEFFRLSGGGNDFLALVEPERDPAAQEIISWCTRGVSAGADGVFVLRRGSDRSSVELSYWNSNGQQADLCLNATRCAARLTHHLGWANDRLEIQTGAARVAAQIRCSDQIRLQVPTPTGDAVPLLLPLDGKDVRGFLLTIGVPHLVVPTDSLSDLDVPNRGRALRRHAELAPNGANVNFVRFPSPGKLEIRTYERGVEDETLACGTGVLAAIYVGLEQRLTTLPTQVQTLGGLPMTVDGTLRDGRLSAWSLTGDARLVASGTLHEGASVRPPTPGWSR